MHSPVTTVRHRATRRIGLWAAAALMVWARLEGAAQPGSKGDRTDTKTCIPGWARVSEKPVRVSLAEGRAVFEGSAILVGCREDLSMLQPEQRAAAAEAIKKLVTHHHFLAVANRDDPALRDEATRVVNEAVGRRVVSDVYLNFSHMRYE
jgi:hypothetical protein